MESFIAVLPCSPAPSRCTHAPWRERGIAPPQHGCSESFPRARCEHLGVHWISVGLLSCGLAPGVCSRSLVLRRRRHARKRRSSGRRAMPDGWQRLSPEEQAKAAAKQRAALRMGDLSEEERQRLASQADTLAPYRNIVEFFGFLCLLGSLTEVFFLLVRSPFQNKVADGASPDAWVLAAFLGAVGVGLLYAGSAWMAAAELPTMAEVLQDIDGDDSKESGSAVTPTDTPSTPTLSLLSGTWCYGVNNQQCYSIQQDVQEIWEYREELNGKAYSAALYPQGPWLQGTLKDYLENKAGTIRVRVGEGGTAISQFRSPGEDAWRKETVACRSTAVQVSVTV